MMKDRTLDKLTENDFPLWLLRRLAWNGVFLVWQLLDLSHLDCLHMKGIDAKGATLIGEWQQIRKVTG
jgi:hypothetical protein